MFELSENLRVGEQIVSHSNELVALVRNRLDQDKLTQMLKSVSRLFFSLF